MNYLVLSSDASVPYVPQQQQNEITQLIPQQQVTQQELLLSGSGNGAHTRNNSISSVGSVENGAAPSVAASTTSSQGNFDIKPLVLL
ncbi:hypothetical protein ACO0QE_002897 [Hanseniaspora vineae]